MKYLLIEITPPFGVILASESGGIRGHPSRIGGMRGQECGDKECRDRNAGTSMISKSQEETEVSSHLEEKFLEA
jgi:hypothetical protein